ncbi:unnamed protein product [Cylicocyclus nassatus]|uniref:Uncharacterized protein n=1 Tax=Cylicocyclus nassatus TaxID=53992 RepID=A0AA36HGV4_CYLNA|nr:unnamed protein product [Cylicocyclus nassatus]
MLRQKKKSSKMYASSEGKFSIIDKFAKDVSDSDVDTPIPRKISENQKRIRSFSKSVDGQSATVAAPSRFRIVPVESKYRRGRWNCFDYYDKDTSKGFKPEIVPLRQNTNARPVRSLNRNYGHHDAKDTIRSSENFEEEDSSESDRENSDIFARLNISDGKVWNLRRASTPAFSRTTPVPEVPLTSLKAHEPPPFQKRGAAGRVMNLRRVSLKAQEEKLQKGLEKSFNPSDARSSQRQRHELWASNSSASMNGTSQTSTLAIDSKIEQAMDLVKTHLMFAVREEVDALRTKITDLESYVFRLETENDILKANIPEEILRSINLGHIG